jgi:hypothetical protein
MNTVFVMCARGLSNHGFVGELKEKNFDVVVDLREAKEATSDLWPGTLALILKARDVPYWRLGPIVLSRSLPQLRPSKGGSGKFHSPATGLICDSEGVSALLDIVRQFNRPCVLTSRQSYNSTASRLLIDELTDQLDVKPVVLGNWIDEVCLVDFPEKEKFFDKRYDFRNVSLYSKNLLTQTLRPVFDGLLTVFHPTSSHSPHSAPRRYIRRPSAVSANDNEVDVQEVVEMLNRDFESTLGVEHYTIVILPRKDTQQADIASVWDSWLGPPCSVSRNLPIRNTRSGDSSIVAPIVGQFSCDLTPKHVLVTKPVFPGIAEAKGGKLEDLCKNEKGRTVASRWSYGNSEVYVLPWIPDVHDLIKTVLDAIAKRRGASAVETSARSGCESPVPEAATKSRVPAAKTKIAARTIPQARPVPPTPTILRIDLERLPVRISGQPEPGRVLRTRLDVPSAGTSNSSDITLHVQLGHRAFLSFLSFYLASQFTKPKDKSIDLHKPKLGGKSLSGLFPKLKGESSQHKPIQYVTDAFDKAAKAAGHPNWKFRIISPAPGARSTGCFWLPPDIASKIRLGRLNSSLRQKRKLNDAEAQILKLLDLSPRR